MAQDEKVTQAFDDFLRAMRDWDRAYANPEIAYMEFFNRTLQRMYRKWQKASEPPGDSHKEWVDAEKMKPSSRLRVLVLDKYAGLAIGLWDNRIKQWEVQPFRLAWHRADKQVTHWRHVPEYDKNWNVPLDESEDDNA